MNNVLMFAAKAVINCALILAASSLLNAQTATTRDGGQSAAPSTNTQTVNAQQSGPWTVGVDPVRNGVKVLSTDSEPVTVKLVGTAAGRKPFQTRILANVTDGSTANTVHMNIPAGKRMVIENISAIGRTGPGIHMQIQLFSYLDNGDGVGDSNDITFHRIALIHQGVFNGITTSAANHKVLVFADEQIGTAHFTIALQVTLDAPATGGLNQGQVTLSGYLEDLPVAP